MATAQQLLNGVCWVNSLQPETAARRDLRSFRLEAWCFRRELIPAAVDLLIPEPTPAEAEVPPLKRGLIYPIDVLVSPPSPPATERPPPAPPSDEGGHGRRQNRRRHRSPSPGASPPDSGGCSATAMPRVSVRSRLGPCPASGGHVAQTEGGPVHDASSAAGGAFQCDEASLEPAPRLDDGQASPLPQASPPPSSVSIDGANHWGGAVETAPSDPLVAPSSGIDPAPEAGSSLGRESEEQQQPEVALEVETQHDSQLTGKQDGGELALSRKSFEGAPSAPTSMLVSNTPAEANLPCPPSPARHNFEDGSILPEHEMQRSSYSPHSPAPLPEASLEGQASAAPLLQRCGQLDSDLAEPSPSRQLQAYSSHRSGTAATQAVTPSDPSTTTTTPLVCSRRHVTASSRRRSPLPETNTQLPKTPTNQQQFFDRITKTVGTLLPAPKINKRRKKALPTSTPPRRSRRVAGLNAEHAAAELPRAKRKVMRALGLGVNRERLLQEDQDNYAKLFSREMSTLHIQALASLCGLVIPSDECVTLFECAA